MDAAVADGDIHKRRYGAVAVAPDAAGIQQADAVNRLIIIDMGMAEADDIAVLLTGQRCQRRRIHEPEVAVAVDHQKAVRADVQRQHHRIFIIVVVVAAHAGEPVQHLPQHFTVSAVQIKIRVRIGGAHILQRFFLAVIVTDEYHPDRFHGSILYQADRS